MKTEFNQIMKELNIPEIESAKFLERIIGCYSESHRDYHNLRHIREMLECLNLYKTAISDYPILYVSCLYHDIVYDTHAQDNEEKVQSIWRKTFMTIYRKKRLQNVRI